MPAVQSPLHPEPQPPRLPEMRARRECLSHGACVVVPVETDQLKIGAVQFHAVKPSTGYQAADSSSGIFLEWSMLVGG